MLRNSFLVAASVLILLMTGAASAEKLVIQNVVIIDPAEAEPQPGMTVVVDGSRIEVVAKTTAGEVWGAARVIDGSGKYLIPGLWDMHVHLRDLGNTLPLFVVNGVTGVRDMGSEIAKTQALKAAIAAGTVLGPRIKSAGLMLESRSWLEQYVEIMRQSAPEAEVQRFLKTRLAVEDAEDAGAAISSLLESGSDFIKIRHAPSKEAFLAIAAAARQRGVQLTGHYVWNVELIDVSNSGQASIEHNILPGFNERDSQEKQRIFDALVRNRTHWVPTLVAAEVETTAFDDLREQVEDRKGERDNRMRYVSPQIYRGWLETIEMNEHDKERPPVEVIREMVDGSNQFLRDAREAGVLMMAGTDAPTTGVFFGFSLHDELRLLVDRYGFTPREALHSATTVPVRFLGLEDELGSIQKGKVADLLLLKADPFDDISNTRAIDAVIYSGRVYDEAALQAILDEIAAGINETAPKGE
ncbi:MAG: amidohydrolase family protein [Acidobacteriota bacterium]|nr:MAG: amidohydrolase family protein [Acidobacteriota bacterium]